MGAKAGPRGGARPLAQAAGAAESRATFSEVFAVAEFRALWAAQLLSVVGDQLARVALMLLVFTRTHSALLSAVTFAASSVPMFVGGLLGLAATLLVTGKGGARSGWRAAVQFARAGCGKLDHG